MSEAIGRFQIVNQLGLHARAATKLVQLASKFPCEVEVARDDQAANGKSVMGVCCSAARRARSSTFARAASGRTTA